MVNPVDTAPEIRQPQFEQPEITAPPDNEAAGLVNDAQRHAPPDTSRRDTNALAQAPAAERADDTLQLEEEVDHRPQPPAADDLEMQPVGRHQPNSDVAVQDDAAQTPAEVRGTPREADYQLAIHQVGASAVRETATVVESPHASGDEEPGEAQDAELRSVKQGADESLDAPAEREGEPAADVGQPPRPPDDPEPPVGGHGDEEEPEEDHSDNAGHDAKDPAARPQPPVRAAAADRTTERESREVAVAPGAGGEAARTEERVYTVERVAQIFDISYGGVRDVLYRSDSLLHFQNAPEGTGQRITNLPAPYINALREYQQQNGIRSFKKAADGFANTPEGQSLAFGLRAEHEDRIREYERDQRGFLTLSQAGEIMNVGPGFLQRHGLVSDVPPAADDTGRIETFVRARGVSGDTVRQTIEWSHAAFKNPMEVPESVYLPSSEVEKTLGCSRRAIIQMTNHGYIPNWRFEAESGRSNRRYPQEYVEELGEHLRSHARMDLIAAAEQFAHEHPDAHTMIRGQFEIGLHRLAQETEGHIPQKQLSEYLHIPQGQFWRTFGPKPDTRGYPLEYVQSRIAWSGAEIVDRERTTVDARGRVRWQVGDPGIREHILGEVAMGRVPTDIARSHGIPPRTVLHWVESARPREAGLDVTGEQAHRERQISASREQLAREFESRREQQELEVATAGKGMGAEAARQIIVDSRQTARQFARWVSDNEESIIRVAESLEEIDQSQLATQIEVARLLAEQHRFYPADMLVGAKIFEDLRPFAQAVPLTEGENPEDRPTLSAREIAALRLATELAKKGRLAYFPDTGV